MYPEGVHKYINKSLELLKVDYVDLYLIHLPVRLREVEDALLPVKSNGEIDMINDVDHIKIWKEMENCVKEGKVKNIGLSNFNEKQIDRILNNCVIKPVNLQIELHAYCQQKDMIEYCKKNDITVTAYSPLGTPGVLSFMSIFGHK